MILQYAPTFEAAIAQGASPPEVAEVLLKTYGKDLMKLVMPTISAQQIKVALKRNGQGNSPLCRRDGQRFLIQVKAELEKLCG